MISQFNAHSQQTKVKHYSNNGNIGSSLLTVLYHSAQITSECVKKCP